MLACMVKTHISLACMLREHTKVACKIRNAEIAIAWPQQIKLARMCASNSCASRALYNSITQKDMQARDCTWCKYCDGNGQWF